MQAFHGDSGTRVLAVVATTILSLAVAAFAPAPASAAATLVVNRTGDASDLAPGDGRCDTSTKAGRQCTLRAAIQEANALAGADTINFNITNAAKVIAPNSPLPPITQRLTINGYSQAGTSPNTEPVGNDAVLGIILNGVNAGAGADGLQVGGRRSVIRGLVIQRFSGSGIVVTADQVAIRGNFIGTNPAGTVDRGNVGAGITINAAEDVVVGGAAVAARNVISGNDAQGIRVNGGARTLVLGNYIGTDAAGSAALGNFQSGIFLDGGSGHTIGGSATGEGNLISGNQRDGIGASEATNSVVAGNLIGVDATGLTALGNLGRGIQLFRGGGFQIGGTTAGARNTISNNLGGIELGVSDDNVVEGNRIGTRVDGTGSMGNRFSGVLVSGTNNRIGGAGAAGNVIANTVVDFGVFVTEIGNVIQGNLISANNGQGVLVRAGDNRLLGNVIIGNAEHGIEIGKPQPAPVGVRVSGNQIFGNGGLGINLDTLTENEFGVNANDPGDGDSGANRLQNFPVLESAVRQANGVTSVAGSLNSVASTEFGIEIYLAVADPSGHGEGQTLVASLLVTTNSSGNANFNVPVVGLAQGHLLTATATNTATNDTSEFSLNRVVTNG